MQIVTAVLAALAVALLALLLVRSLAVSTRERDADARHEARLAELRVALAQAQGETLARVSGQIAETVDRFHSRLQEFGQGVQNGQASAGQSLQKGLEETRRTLTEQLRGLVGEVNVQLGRSQETFGKQFEGATKVFGELRGQLGQVAEMAVRMETLGREIEDLQGILKSPKLRGGMGEAQLEEFLRQVLPGAFWETQYGFAGGQKVDAVIRLGGRLVPIDAKFPLESFQRLLAAEDDAGRKAARREFERAVKARIDEISDKYIRPGEGTFDFGLMFIPAENVYYEVIIRDEPRSEAGSLLAYATAKRVVPVSPNSFYAYLMTIATGLRGLQVEARAREILAELAHLQREYERFNEAFKTLGRHLENARTKYDDAGKLAGRLGDRLESAAGEPSASTLEGGGAALAPTLDTPEDGGV
jgi:DNA recombination protein RmuC